MSLLEVLFKARALIANTGWSYPMPMDSSGRYCCPDAEDLVAWDVVSAIDSACGDDIELATTAYDALDFVAGYLIDEIESDPSTTKTIVLALFDKAIRKSKRAEAA